MSTKADKETDTVRAQAERERKKSAAEAHVRENSQQQHVDQKLQRSEMLLRETQSIASIGSFSYDLDRDEMEWTDEMYYIHGYQPGDVALTLSGIVSHTHSSDRARVEDIINNALLKRKDYAFTMLFVRPDGTTCHIHNMGRFVMVADQGECLVGTAQDVTTLKQAETEIKKKNLELQQSNERLLKEIEERKQAEAALRESEEKWRTLVENTPDVVCRFDADLRFIFANNSTQRKLSLKPEDILGKTYAELGLPKIVSKYSKASISQVFDTGKQTTRYVSIQTTEGKKEYYSISVPEFDENGSVRTVLNISRDVTEVKQKENLLQAVLNSSINGIGALKAIRDEKNKIVDFRFLHVNRQAQAMLHKTNEQLQHKTLLEVLPGFLESGMLDKYIRTVETGETLNETFYYGHNHLPAWYQVVAVKLEDGLVATVADINEQTLTALALEQANKDLLKEIAERKEAVRVAREEKDLKESIIEHVTDGISAFDKDGTYTAWNKTLELYTGIKREAVLGKKFEEVFPMLRHSEIGDKIGRALKGEHARLRNIPFMNRSGAYDAEVVPNFDQNGELIGGIFIVHDITESLEVKEKAIAKNLSQQKIVLDAVLEAQEEERKRIAETLHNGLGQLLYGIRLYTDQLEIEKVKAPGKNTKIKQQIDSLLTDAIDSVRSISYELTPAILKEFGLETALNELCDKLSKAALTVSLAAFELHTPLQERTELVAYRIIQELINNILKHAGATSAEIEVEQNSGQLVISVSDNGKGFKQEDKIRKGIGLYSITNRVKLLNGKMEIISTENKGSKVKVVLPLTC